MPWWGWLIASVVALVGLYYVVALVFFTKATKRVFNTVDRVQQHGPFDDDPFFNNPLFTTKRRR